MSKTSATLLALTGVLAATSSVLSVSAQPSAETKSQHEARMAWWRAARFGMFIYWGLYAVPGGYGTGNLSPDAR